MNIKDESEVQKEENIFIEDEINIDEVRKDINNLMNEFIWAVDYDFYGNPEEKKRFDLTTDIDEEKIEIFLDNIDQVIDSNIFRKEISVEFFFENNNFIFSYYDIEVETMIKISDLYKRVKGTKYKKAFINFIKQKINENKVNTLLNSESDDDDLP